MMQLRLGWVGIFGGLVACAGVQAAYQVPAYEPVPGAISKVSIDCESKMAAGGTAKVGFEVQVSRAVDSPRKLFVHLIRETRAGEVAETKPQVMHVAVFPGGDSAGIKPKLFV